MTLPKIEYPIFSFTNPLNKSQKLRCRPALVRDQKILLLAKESGDNKDILSAVKQVVNNCFHRNTKILTLEYGSVEIDEIVNEEVTVRCKDGVWRKANVKSYGKQKLFIYGFGGIQEKKDKIRFVEIATENHRWFLKDDSVTTKLDVGDVLKAPFREFNFDPIAVVHGIIFGDGSCHKRRKEYDDCIITQGKEYPAIRVCKQDKVKDEIMKYLEQAGYEPRYPKFSDGDPIYHLGRVAGLKDLPHTHDPSYIAGFIYGWWLADGSKENGNTLKISTIRNDAVEWLEEYAPFAGYWVSGKINNSNWENNKGKYNNAKPLNIVTLSSNSLIVRSKEEFIEDEVFCIEEPVTHSFTLGSGIVTGNCLVDDLNVDDFPIVLLEYCFIKIQANSVNNILKFYHRDDEDEKAHELEVDLNAVEMFFPKTTKDGNLIKINNNIGLVMRYPLAKLYEDDEFLNAKNYVFELILRCIESIANGDEVHEAKDYKIEDLREFVEQLDIKTFEKIENYMASQPFIRHEVKYKNSKGNERTVVLNNLADFFMLF